MKKGELYDSFDKLQAQANRLTEQIASLKQEMMSIIEQNAELQISNEHLRTRLREAESKRQKNEPEKGLSKSRRNLEKLYEEGFHVCNVDNMFGSRRINNEPCVFCQDVIYGDRRHDTTKIK